MFEFDNTYARQMEGFFTLWQAQLAEEPTLLAFNEPLACELGLPASEDSRQAILDLVSGQKMPEGAQPLAQVYAGHQFGGFSPQLGDGRALLVGEIIDQNGRRRDLQLKGSGATPYSRGGDGKSALGPVLREYLISEAMHALNVPTTRALAAIATGEQVAREQLQPGGVMARVAASHIRVGTFQFFASRGETDKVRQLTEYAINRHYPEINLSDGLSALQLFNAVSQAQAKLVARWMSLGFIHGVMNTDNMSISGETIDYGPCAFMDRYDPATVFSSIDRQGRYAYGNQPSIAQWNLARLAECLVPLVDEDQDKAIEMLSKQLVQFENFYLDAWLSEMSRKIGLHKNVGFGLEEDQKLIVDLLDIMSAQHCDFTLTFRGLANVLRGVKDALAGIANNPTQFDDWLARWNERLGHTADLQSIASSMDAANPAIIPRNHKVEEALAEAVNGNNMEPFMRLSRALAQPYVVDAGEEDFTQPAPVDAPPYRTFCGT